jgi:hypothetical protein
VTTTGLRTTTTLCCFLPGHIHNHKEEAFHVLLTRLLERITLRVGKGYIGLAPENTIKGNSIALLEEEGCVLFGDGRRALGRLSGTVTSTGLWTVRHTTQGSRARYGLNDDAISISERSIILYYGDLSIRLERRLLLKPKDLLYMPLLRTFVQGHIKIP